MRSNSDYLFHNGGDLSNYLHGMEVSVKEKVDGIKKDQFAVNSDDKIIEHVCGMLRLEPLNVYVDQQSITKPIEKKVDVSNDPRRGIYYRDDRRGPFYIDGVEISLHIPYTGDRTLWELTPSRRYPGNAPRARIEVSRQNPLQGEIIITQSLPADIGQEEMAQRMKAVFDEQRNMIVEYAQWSRNDVDAFNNRLPAIIRRSVEERRKYIEQTDELLSMIDIHIRPDANAPPIIPVQLRPHIAVELTPPPRTGVKPEYGIRSDIYQKILEIIRHEARSFETTPETFNLLEEEQLRDVLLAHLNGHFKGAATAEAFRKKGKTDIRIEEQGRSAFVAECKVWSGQAQLKKALDQLLDYLVWRDCKACLIIFDKNVAAFSELLKKVPDTLGTHELLVRSLGNQPEGEWSYLFRSKEDPGREITVHVFLINVFFEKKARLTKQVTTL